MKSFKLSQDLFGGWSLIPDDHNCAYGCGGIAVFVIIFGILIKNSIRPEAVQDIKNGWNIFTAILQGGLSLASLGFTIALIVNAKEAFDLSDIRERVISIFYVLASLIPLSLFILMYFNGVNLWQGIWIGLNWIASIIVSIIRFIGAAIQSWLFGN